MGKVIHFEVPYKDFERAKKFYSDIFDWEIFDSGMEGVEYYLAHTGPTNKNDGMALESGFINGGMMKKDEETQYPVLVMGVSSIDEALKKAESLGAKVILPKNQVGDMGFYARVADPEGNVIGIWENAVKEKILKCRDLGTDCDFVAKGKTNEEVKDKMMEHAAEAHKEVMEDMTEEKMKEMEDKMDKNIKEQ